MIHAALWVASFLFLCAVGLAALVFVLYLLSLILTTAGRAAGAILYQPFVLLNAILDTTSGRTSKWKWRRLAWVVDRFTEVITMFMILISVGIIWYFTLTGWRVLTR
jgi:hypothetical protein